MMMMMMMIMESSLISSSYSSPLIITIIIIISLHHHFHHRQHNIIICGDVDDALHLLGLQQVMRQEGSRQALCCIKVTVVAPHIYDVLKRLFVLCFIIDIVFY